MENDQELPALLEALAHIQEPEVCDIEYRLYHDEAGVPLFMSSSGHPEGVYIAIDRETYDRADYLHLRVRGGKLVKIEDDFEHHSELTRGVSGYTVVKNHASIVVRDNETYQGETETYGFKNH